MTIPGRSLKFFMALAANGYHRLPGTETKLRSLNTEADAEELKQDDDAEQATSHGLPEDQESSTQSPLEIDSIVRPEGGAAHEPSESPSPSFSEMLSEPEGNPDDEANAVTQESPEDNAPSLAEILANPLPPELSVDHMLSETLGNIFQKRVTKDPNMKALLDLHGDINMRDLAAELKEFANEIGASDNRD